MDVQFAYDTWASTYDGAVNLTRDLYKKVTETVLKNAKVHHILELGCGTGKNTTFYAGISDHVTCVDFSSEMMSRARTRIRRETDQVESALAACYRIARERARAVRVYRTKELDDDSARHFQSARRAAETG